MANKILEDDETVEEIISKICTLTPGNGPTGTSPRIHGENKLADEMAYITMPVISGYLAFIRCVCLETGVALRISKPMATFMDWKYMLEQKYFFLLVPGLLTGLVLSLVSRKAESDLTLPFSMVGISADSYVEIYVTGMGMSGIIMGGWVGEISEPVPIGDLIKSMNFKLVCWDITPKYVFTWVGMVFVVSFYSFLDTGAVSIDMGGEYLDSNAELTTVDI